MPAFTNKMHVNAKREEAAGTDDQTGQQSEKCLPLDAYQPVENQEENWKMQRQKSTGAAGQFKYRIYQIPPKEKFKDHVQHAFFKMLSSPITIKPPTTKSRPAPTILNFTMAHARAIAGSHIRSEFCNSAIRAQFSTAF